jgi:hypothetical protein
MNMIRHQAIGVDRAAEPQSESAEVSEVLGIVVRPEKARHAIVTPLHKVQRDLGNDQTGHARHVVATNQASAR